MTIRAETIDDHMAITKVNDLAFGQTAEGMLVGKLRKHPHFIPELSLVADSGDGIVGHILFFPIRIKDGIKSHPSLALAPMSVLPEFQRQGIGTRLIITGLKNAKNLGHKSVIVLGHSGYYPRFGFLPASKWNIKTTYDVPDEVFMAIELEEDGLKDVSGVVEYPKEFEDVG